jgi:outer membrane lipoprotein-sorting protein
MIFARDRLPRALAAAGLALTLATTAAAAEPAAIAGMSGGAKLDALVAEVSARQKGLASLRAHFVQVKESSLLAAPVQSSGTLAYAAPDRVRWDYAAPEAMTILVADGRLTTYHPDLGRAEVVKVSANQRRLVGIIAGSQSLEEMRSRFKITLNDRAGEPSYHLTLEPATMVLKRRLDTIHIEVDRELLLPVMVEYLEADGDRTRYTFSALELNPEVRREVFELELAAGVVVETVDATSGDS